MVSVKKEIAGLQTGDFSRNHLKFLNRSSSTGRSKANTQSLIIKASIYRVSREEMSIFCEVTVLVILSKKVYMYMCPIPSGFRDRAIALNRSLNLAPNIVFHSPRTAPH